MHLFLTPVLLPFLNSFHPDSHSWHWARIIQRVRKEYTEPIVVHIYVSALSLVRLCKLYTCLKNCKRNGCPFAFHLKVCFPNKLSFVKSIIILFVSPNTPNPPLAVPSDSPWAPSSLSCLHYPDSSSTFSFSRSPPPWFFLNFLQYIHFLPWHLSMIAFQISLLSEEKKQ